MRSTRQRKAIFRDECTDEDKAGGKQGLLAGDLLHGNTVQEILLKLFVHDRETGIKPAKLCVPEFERGPLDGGRTQSRRRRV